ncbi:trichoplein keratin filament-binding protein isoform X2 [Syngnathoides biaculeatus]|uniref:trichoplein keratin filament-binding protein isoform X2 n=1 Tax=Syngnathoides biaculeatus TaxID=300417 RepID=UPI002ADDCB3A|nr:trichoplein keratin filament-binding protein isoform X2 [Syngnathoides biaculeatus]
MALPTLSTYVPYRQRALGIQLAWKREQQFRRREQLALNAKYFREQSFRNHFHSEWTSRHYFEQSMSAYCKQKLEDDKMNTLEERKLRLKQMLDEEQKQLDAELKRLRPHGGGLPKKADVQHALKEERRKKLAQELLKEHRKRNNVESQQHATASHQSHLGNQNQGQISEKQEVEAHESRRFQNGCERSRKEDLDEIKQAEESRMAEESDRAQKVHKQMEELKLMEEEATHLKKEEDVLQVNLWELDKMEAERRNCEERRKKAEMRHFLVRQYRAQLRRRAQLVQEELESDHKILVALLKGEQEEVRKERAPRERAFADAAWMSRVIEEQLRLEREREAELDFLHREDAQRVWDNRQETWERERKARELLMHEVLVGRRQKLELRMQKNREAQLESLRRREELIQELEKEKELRRREKEEEQSRRAQQVEQELQEQCRIEELQEEEMNAHLSQEEALKRSILNRAYQAQINSKPRVVWT